MVGHCLHKVLKQRPVGRSQSNFISSIIVVGHCLHKVLKQRPVGRSQSNFISSIIVVGHCLHKVLKQIESELWLLWQQTTPIDFVWRKCCPRIISVIFNWTFSILARNNNNLHKSSNEFEIQPDPTSGCGVICP